MNKRNSYTGEMYSVVKDTADPNSDDPRWLFGDFARLTKFSSLFPTLCRDISEELNDLYQLNSKPIDVVLHKTYASMGKHVDLYRSYAVNCFLRNAECAHVNFFERREDETPISTLFTETGKAYFMFTQKVHEVVQLPNQLRYFIGVTLFDDTQERNPFFLPCQN